MTGSIRAGDFADATESGVYEYRVEEIFVGSSYHSKSGVIIERDEEIVNEEFVTDEGRKTLRVWIRRRTDLKEDAE